MGSMTIVKSIMVIPIENVCPASRVVPFIPEACPKIFASTELMITLKYGGEKRLNPTPNITRQARMVQNGENLLVHDARQCDIDGRNIERRGEPCGYPDDKQELPDIRVQGVIRHGIESQTVERFGDIHPGY